MRWKTYVAPPDGTRELFFAWWPEDTADGHTYWLTWLYGTRHTVSYLFEGGGVSSVVHLDPRKDA